MKLSALTKLLPVEPAMLKQIEAFANTASDPVQFVRNSVSGPLFQPHVQTLAAYLEQTGASIRLDLIRNPNDPSQRGFLFTAMHPDGSEEVLNNYFSQVPNEA